MKKSLAFLAFGLGCLSARATPLISELATPPIARPAGVTAASDVAKPRQAPSGAPLAADVMMRSLRVHPANEKDPHDTLKATRAFHVTRLDWIPYLSLEFVREAGSGGIPVSASLSASIPRMTDGAADRMSLRDLNGEPVCMKHKRDWSWNKEGCVNNPEYQKWYETAVFNFLDMGCAGLQRDEPGANINVTRYGGCFCAHCMAGFRQFLAVNTMPEQRRQLGGEPVTEFDYGAYLRKIGAPTGDAFEKWDGGELKRLFIEFQRESTVAFHRRMRQAANDHAGHVVPWSCNNGARYWDPERMVFDYFIGELSLSKAKPQYLHEIFRKAEELQKVQVITMPLTGKPIGNDDIRPITRKTIATAYALGGLCMVPWDTYMPKDQPRYFGKPGEYADLFAFVRANDRFLDRYGTAGAFGPGIPEDRYGQSSPLILEGENRKLYAFLRAIPGSSGDAVVIHLVDWNEKASQPAVLKLRTAAFFGNQPLDIQLRTPKPFDAAAHTDAEEKARSLRKPTDRLGPLQSAAYEPLVQHLHLDTTPSGEFTRIELPPLDPWGILVVTPKR